MVYMRAPIQKAKHSNIQPGTLCILLGQEIFGVYICVQMLINKCGSRGEKALAVRLFRILLIENIFLVSHASNNKL